MLACWSVPYFGELRVISGAGGSSPISSECGAWLMHSLRWCFNITLLLAGVFGLVAGAANTFVALAALLAVMGVGVGGSHFTVYLSRPLLICPFREPPN